MTILKVDVLALLDAGFHLKQGLNRKTHQDQWTKKLHAHPSGPHATNLVFEMPEIDGDTIRAFAHLENEDDFNFYRQTLSDNGVPFAVVVK